MSHGEIAEMILGLRDITRTTGMLTKRAQTRLFNNLNDEELAQLARIIRMKEGKENVRTTTAR